MKSIFIAGTDTSVGKTVVCGCLMRYLLSKGINTGIQKWVSTGSRGFSADVKTVLKMAGRNFRDYDQELVCPYNFSFPSSPHLSARLDKAGIDKRKIKKSYHALMKNHEILLVEGVGGVMVPLNSKTLLIDLVKELSIPVIIVSSNKLGTINHSLLTIEALRKRKIKILGMIMNSVADEYGMIRKDNGNIIGEIGNIEILGSITKSKSMRSIYNKFLPIGRKVHKRILELK